MKKKKLLAIVLIAGSLLGCGTNTSNTKEVKNPQGEDEIQSQEAAKNDGHTFIPDKPVPPDEIWEKCVSERNITVDEESAKLYEGFVKGEVPVEYDAEADRDCFYTLPSQVLEDKESYTLPEINKRLTDWTIYDPYSEMELNGDEYKLTYAYYVDLGLDEKYELQVGISAYEYKLDMVIKNYEGHLKICYSVDSWTRSEAHIYFSGMVKKGGSCGVSSYGEDIGYLDADGKYHFFYSLYDENLDRESVKEDKQEEIFDSAKWENWTPNVVEIILGNDKTYKMIYIADDNNFGEDLEIDESDPNNPYQQLKEAINFQVQTREEIEQYKEKYRKEIGLSDAVYHYEDEE